MKKGRFKLPITAAKVDLGVRPLKVQFIEWPRRRRRGYVGLGSSNAKALSCFTATTGSRSSLVFHVCHIVPRSDASSMPPSRGRIRCLLALTFLVAANSYC